MANTVPFRKKSQVVPEALDTALGVGQALSMTTDKSARIVEFLKECLSGSEDLFNREVENLGMAISPLQEEGITNLHCREFDKQAAWVSRVANRIAYLGYILHEVKIIAAEPAPSDPEPVEGLCERVLMLESAAEESRTRLENLEMFANGQQVFSDGQTKMNDGFLERFEETEAEIRAQQNVNRNNGVRFRALETRVKGRDEAGIILLKRIDILETMLQEKDEETGSLRGRIKKLEERLDSHAGRLTVEEDKSAKLFRRIDGLEDDIDSAERRLREIGAQLNAPPIS